MANNNITIPSNNIDLISWANNVNARNDAKAKQTNENIMNTLKMLGIAGEGIAQGYDSNTNTQNIEDYYNNNWSNYTPEEQIKLLNLGFNPSLYNRMNTKYGV